MLDKQPINEQGQPHGYWDCYYAKNPWYNVYYINCKPIGFCRVYDPLGKLIIKDYYAK